MMRSPWRRTGSRPRQLGRAAHEPQALPRTLQRCCARATAARGPLLGPAPTAAACGLRPMGLSY